MTYNLNDPCDIYAPTQDITQGRISVSGTLTVYFADKFLLKQFYRPTGHWIAYPRKWKRNQRKTWQQVNNLSKRKSRGYRKHIRRMKAKL